MTELVITGAGSGLCDSILEVIEAVEGDYRLRLVDSMESAGEARRFQGRTVVIELDTEADCATADLVFDLNDTYTGDALVFKPMASLFVMLKRLFGDLAVDSIKTLHGVVREPAVAQQQGVEALAGQVTQLFNGRDPESLPFGGTLAFNARILDESALVESIYDLNALRNANISIERLQSDSFYTVHTSLWLQTSDGQSIDSIISQATDQYSAGLGISPDSGRVTNDSDMRICVRQIAKDWVHLMLTADLEKTIWAREAHEVLKNYLTAT
ncbi:hypothetical protein OA249_03680 [Litorivicinus sp.]|nr:hypothetical protein [Litorivicinus sp.]